MSNQIPYENTTSQHITNSIKTLNIIEAAKFLGAHKETIRRMAASGILPAVKIGRSWRFIEQDLASHMRSLYDMHNEISVKNNDGNLKKWLSQKEKTSGGSTSLTRENEYAKALGLQ